MLVREAIYPSMKANSTLRFSRETGPIVTFDQVCGEIADPRVDGRWRKIEMC